MLGKEAYDLARTDIDGYVRAVKSGIYPHNLGEEFWAIFYDVFKKKIGLDKYKYGDKFISKALPEKVKKFLEDLDKKYDKLT